MIFWHSINMPNYKPKVNVTIDPDVEPEPYKPNDPGVEPEPCVVKIESIEPHVPVPLLCTDVLKTMAASFGLGVLIGGILVYSFSKTEAE